MREIKFRAKATSGKGGYDWYYGFLAKCAVSRTEFEYCIVYWNEEYQGFANAAVSPEDENTIGQFTGLCDKNGKEIYEGDIVKTTYSEKRDYGGVKYDNNFSFVEQIVFRNGAFQIELDNYGFKEHRYLDPHFVTSNGIKLKEVEVLGNVWENPELLEANNG